MKNTGLQKLAFNTLDRITDVFPSFGPKVFQKIFLYVFGSSILYNFNLHKYQKKLLNTTSFDRILIVGDVNIGDSMISQSCVVLVKIFFPLSQVDYICNNTGGELIYESPIANNIFKLYKKSGLPTEEDNEQVDGIVKNGNYNLILNFSPFIKKRVLKYGANVIHLYIPFAYYICSLWKKNDSNLNISRATHIFIQNLFRPLLKSHVLFSNNGVEQKLNIPFNGNRIFVKQEGLESAKEFLKENNLYPAERLLLFNPFVTSKFSMIPIDLQIGILNNLLLTEDINKILIYEGNSGYNLDEIILEKLPVSLKNKIVKIPNSISIHAYSALIDFCDMFFSGDTGTVHVAASRKMPMNSNYSFRNRTSVVSVYGASDSRMYGYDSEAYGHNPANQDVPSKSFVGAAPCRTITCINRLVKTCRDIRCFQGLEANEISVYIINYFKNLNYPVKKQKEIEISVNKYDSISNIN